MSSNHPDTVSPTTPQTNPNPSGSGDNSNDTNNNTGNNNNNRRRNNNSNRNQSSTSVQLTNPKGYEGSIAEIGAILGLKHEKLDKKTQYQVFVDKIANYVYSNVKYGGDLLPLFKDLVNPEGTYKKNANLPN